MVQFQRKSRAACILCCKVCTGGVNPKKNRNLPTAANTNNNNDNDNNINNTTNNIPHHKNRQGNSSHHGCHECAILLAEEKNGGHKINRNILSDTDMRRSIILCIKPRAYPGNINNDKSCWDIWHSGMDIPIFCQRITTNKNDIINNNIKNDINNSIKSDINNVINDNTGMKTPLICQRIIINKNDIIAK